MKSLNTRVFVLAATLPILATPLVGHADTAMDACVKAFIGATLPKEQPVKVIKDEPVVSPLLGSSQTEQISLTAKISRTGEHVAQATCTVDRHGAVITLNATPKNRMAAR